MELDQFVKHPEFLDSIVSCKNDKERFQTMLVYADFLEESGNVPLADGWRYVANHQKIPLQSSFGVNSVFMEEVWGWYVCSGMESVCVEAHQVFITDSNKGHPKWIPYNLSWRNSRIEAEIWLANKRGAQ